MSLAGKLAEERRARLAAERLLELKQAELHAANRKLFQFAKWAGIKNLSADPTEDAFDRLDKLCAEYPVLAFRSRHLLRPPTRS